MKAGLYQQSGILTGAAAQEDLATKTTEITKEKTTKKSLRSDRPRFPGACPFVGFVFFVLEHFRRRRAGQPPSRLVGPAGLGLRHGLDVVSVLPLGSPRISPHTAPATANDAVSRSAAFARPIYAIP